MVRPVCVSGLTLSRHICVQFPIHKGIVYEMRIMTEGRSDQDLSLSRDGVCCRMPGTPRFRAPVRLLETRGGDFGLGSGGVGVDRTHGRNTGKIGAERQGAQVGQDVS